MSDTGELVRHARQLLAAVQAAADPAAAIARQWGLISAAITPANAATNPGSDHQPTAPRVHLLAIGKASVDMAREAASRLLQMRTINFLGGIITCPPECIPTGAHAATFPDTIRVLPADHPRSTARNAANTHEIEAFLRTVGEHDVLLALISGGASAHLASPAPSLTIADLDDVYTALRRAGADIGELNAVRKHCERLKGGRLAALCKGRIVAAILSDVIGDRLDVIASGPTAPDPTTFADAIAVLDRFAIKGEHAANVRSLLHRGAQGAAPETPKPGDPAFSRATNIIIGSSRGVLHAAAETAAKLGYHVVTRPDVTGDAITAAHDFINQALQLRRSRCGALALVWAGETTVQVDASMLRPGESLGRGGPSQEFALAAALALSHQNDAADAAKLVPHFALLAYSTDGIDGESDNAGALITNESWIKSRELRLGAQRSLARHDAAGFLEACGSHLRTGPTGTNVNHVAALLLHAKKK